MNLTKENVKKICGIILFTVVVLVIVQNYEKVGNAIGILWGIIFPFVLGGIIAFILNIPMRAIEKLLFKSKNGKQKKYARPLSMIITFLLVIGVIAGVILIVVPQIGGTVRELTKSAEAFFYRNGQRICSVIIRKSMIGLQVCSSIPTNLWILR